MALLANCNAPILLKFCSQLYDLNIRYRYLAGRSPSYESRDLKPEHAAFLEAVAGDCDQASDCLLTHYRENGAFRSGILSENALA